MPIKALGFKTSGVFNVVFVNNTVPTETPTNETNAEIETHPMTAEMKTKKCSKQFKALHNFELFIH